MFDKYYSTAKVRIFEKKTIFVLKLLCINNENKQYKLRNDAIYDDGNIILIPGNAIKSAGLASIPWTKPE